MNKVHDDIKAASKKRQQTAQRIIKAIEETNGFITAAAKRAGVSYVTIERYVRDFPTVQRAVYEAKEGMKDYAESKLFAAIKENNMTAIIFYLKTQAKDRGYTEKALTEHSGELKTIIEVQYEGGEEKK